MWVLAISVCMVVLACGGARELDPAACGARFDVQRDKIIRTEESREMGARYLSELDVGSRPECRRLCCETDTCTVFVYEEKSPGSCYLFNCGPPEDFRCKFTEHGNFSSGVLAISRRLAELQDQERLAPPPPPPPPSSTTTTTTTPAPTPRPIVTAPPPAAVFFHPHTTPPPQNAGGGSGRCSRYQWECHSGGECIAVYNACDGIPQCADGSDEAPELGCPAAPPAAAPARTAPPPPVAPLPRPHQPLYQMYDSEAGAGAEAAAEAVASVSGGERWPHRLLQAQPRRYPSNELGGSAGAGMGVGAGPHIFSHAGGLVQEEPAPAFEPPQAQQPWPRRPSSSWGNHQGVERESSGWGGWGREWSDEQRWPPAPPRGPAPPSSPLHEPETPPYLYQGPMTMPEMPPVFPPQQHSLHDAPKKGLGLTRPPAPSPPPGQPPAPPAPRPLDSTTKKKPAAVPEEPKLESAAVVVSPEAHATKAASSAHASSAAGAAAVAAAGAGRGEVGAGAGAAAQRDEHDGLSEHPPAAIMLLILGVAMTGATGVLAGCRARAARRRLRRGARHAHDADYLVNGMYL